MFSKLGLSMGPPRPDQPRILKMDASCSVKKIWGYEGSKDWLVDGYV